MVGGGAFVNPLPPSEWTGDSDLLITPLIKYQHMTLMTILATNLWIKYPTDNPLNPTISPQERGLGMDSLS